ncbi:MAG TPA: S41 family peptidase, partial [Trueperaceae bacterium]
VKDKVLFSSRPVEGSLDQEWFGAGPPPAKGKLECYDLRARTNETLVDGITTFVVSQDGSTLAYRAGNRLRILEAGKKPPEEDGRDGEPGRKSGWLDLDRIKVSVVPQMEWEQMYREAWRMQRDHFWTPDMSGIDWQGVYERYLPLLKRAATRSEVSDVLREMQGELGTSHAYEIGGDYRAEPQYPQGHLGAEFAFDQATASYVVTRVIRGDPWSDEAGSPLARAGIDVQPGDRLVAIGGQRLNRDVSPQSLLVHQAGLWVQLRVVPAGGGPARTITVKTLRNEHPARYRDWVESNRQVVHQATEGRVGYVHIPDMGPSGYAEFHRGFLAEADRDGLIVDVRYNGGGHVSELLLEKLARKRLGYDIQRWGEPSPYPSLSVVGPIVALTNEFAGSDGDIFSHAFKMLGLGPLIGKRTWGGVIGINLNDRLQDGSITTQPEFSFWFTDVGFGVENYGTDPTITVEIRPQDYVAGRDTQLDRGLEEIKRMLAAGGVRKPAFGERPRLAAPPLPEA